MQATLRDPRSELIVARAHANHARALAEGLVQLVIDLRDIGRALLRGLLGRLAPSAPDEAFLAQARNGAELRERLLRLQALRAAAPLDVGR
jgi:hypothetical protein